MIEPRRRLGATDLEQLAALERRVVDADGGRLKLEWDSLRSRDGTAVHDLLAWDGETLVGFVGLYTFGSPTVELVGMVDPTRRRRGIGSALLDAALAAADERGHSRALLVVPSATPAGAAFAQRHGARVDHSEHAMVLRGTLTEGPTRRALCLRAAIDADTEALQRIYAATFGGPAPDVRSRLRETTVIEDSGEVVGALRTTRDADVVSVYGLAVDPPRQGRGIARDALRRTCVEARRAGATVVRLEVATDNDRALHLYTSLGFVAEAGEDYWALPGNARRNRAPVSPGSAT